MSLLFSEPPSSSPPSLHSPPFRFVLSRLRLLLSFSIGACRHKEDTRRRPSIRCNVTTRPFSTVGNVFAVRCTLVLNTVGVSVLMWLGTRCSSDRESSKHPIKPRSVVGVVLIHCDLAGFTIVTDLTRCCGASQIQNPSRDGLCRSNPFHRTRFPPRHFEFPSLHHTGASPHRRAPLLLQSSLCSLVPSSFLVVLFSPFSASSLHLPLINVFLCPHVVCVWVRLLPGWFRPPCLPSRTGRRPRHQRIGVSPLRNAIRRRVSARMPSSSARH